MIQMSFEAVSKPLTDLPRIRHYHSEFWHRCAGT